MDNEESLLDVYLAKATNPLNGDIDDEVLNGLCLSINGRSDGRSDGPQIALRFLAHKIQSPQEIEALMAIKVLEKLIPNCGHRLVEEIGKFRFLNEIIKVVSPKYLAHRSSPKVKQRIIELMFLWSLELKEQPKLLEAYQMLKKQGIITEDPTHILPNYRPPTPPLPRPKDEIFDDEKNAKLLQNLLKSGRPEDLEAANRLIKSMAREADKRMDLKTRFESEMETVYNNTKVLSDMLSLYSPNDSSSEEKDLMKELFESCERLRIRLFKLANDLSDNDPNLSTIFSANEELTKVINSYKHSFGIISKDNSNIESIGSEDKPLNLLDITAQTIESQNDVDSELLEDHIYVSTLSTNNTVLQELGEIFSQNNFDSNIQNSLVNHILLPEPIRPSNSLKSESEVRQERRKSGALSALEELNALSESLLKTNLSNDSFKHNSNHLNSDSSKTSLNELQRIQSNAKNEKEREKTETNDSVFPLTDVSVSLESIKPSLHSKPITLYDKNDLKVILHLASNSPRIDVKVVVITFVNTNHFLISNINFLAAVPKSMRVKLQPMSGNTLPAFRPFIAPTVLTQVMLIARNVNKAENVRLKYKFSFKINDELHSEVGEIDCLFDDYDKS